MTTPVCTPLMGPSTPRCRCPQCEMVAALRPDFPDMVALRFSRDGLHLAFVAVVDDGHELWLGERDPLRLRRVWRTPSDAALAPPVLSPTGEETCVPLLGPDPGLFIVGCDETPRRLTAGYDVDPRWHGPHIGFYRLEAGRPVLMRAALAAA